MFDPFGDFATRGYLRNVAAEKDPDIVKRLEHTAFRARIYDALDHLAPIEHLTYADVLQTHKTLFERVYPWAGQDRLATAPDIAVSKGETLFAHPRDAKAAVEHALALGQDQAVMAAKPGEVMGYLAYGHPFLDGNGRTIMVLHAELAQRAGFSINWAATDKTEYLTALTRELERPGRGELDAYLKPHIQPGIARDSLAAHIVQTPGLGGTSDRSGATNQVLGTFSEPAVESRYRHQQERRQQAEASPPDLSPPRELRGRGSR